MDGDQRSYVMYYLDRDLADYQDDQEARCPICYEHIDNEWTCNCCRECESETCTCDDEEE